MCFGLTKTILRSAARPMFVRNAPADLTLTNGVDKASFSEWGLHNADRPVLSTTIRVAGFARNSGYSGNFGLGSRAHRLFAACIIENISALEVSR